MKSISYWASRHLWPARLLLVGAHVLLTLLALFVGKSLIVLHLSLPYYLVYVLILPFAAAWISHPGGHCSSTYTRRKWCEGTAGAIGFLLIVCLANQRSPAAGGSAPAFSMSSLESAFKSQVVNSRLLEKKPLFKKKHLRQRLADNIQVIRKLYRQGPKGLKYTLILLSVLVAVVLLNLAAALSCEIACSGYETLALLVLVFGSALVIFLTVQVIKAIQRKYLRDLRKRGNPPAKEPASLHR